MEKQKISNSHRQILAFTMQTPHFKIITQSFVCPTQSMWINCSLKSSRPELRHSDKGKSNTDTLMHSGKALGTYKSHSITVVIHSKWECIFHLTLHDEWTSNCPSSPCRPSDHSTACPGYLVAWRLSSLIALTDGHSKHRIHLRENSWQ